MNAPITPGQGFAQAGPDPRVLERYDTLEQAKGNEALALAVTQGPSVANIYRPGMPIRMVSALDPTALKEGEFALLQNVRPDADVITARYPTTLFQGAAGSPQTTTFSPSLAGGSSARGVWSGNLNGARYVVTAWFDGTAVRLYTSTNGYTFTEVTSTSSAYGIGGAGNPTRFADSGSNCAFQSVTNSSPTGAATDFLIVQNGVAPAMLFSTNALHGGNVFPIQSVSAPTAYETTAPQISVLSYWNFNSWTLSSSNPVANGLSIAGSPTDGAWGFNITPSLTAGGQSVLQTATSSEFLATQNAGQICVLLAYQSGFDAYVCGCKFEVFDQTSSGWQVVFDPSTNTGSATAGTGAQPTTVGLAPVLLYGPAEVLAYSSPLLATANAGAGMQITQLRWTVPAGMAAPSVTGSAAVFGLYAGGLVSAQSSLAVSFSNSATLTESPSVVLLPATGTPSFSSIGVPSIGNVFTGSLPDDPSLLYGLSFLSQPSSQFVSGVDSLNLYVSEPGSTSYGYLSTTSISSYSGSWSSLTQTSVVVGGSSSRTSVVAGGNPVDTYTAPDAYIASMPSGTCLAAGGGRTFVGAGSQYWFSEYSYPFRYRLVLDVENGVARSSSGGYVTLPNTEKCVAWAVSGASALGTSNLFLFTNASTYNVQGPDGQSLSQPTLLASVGCSAPDSVAIYRDAIFFLDDNYQIVKFAYGQSQFYFYQNVNSYQLMQPISKRVVDDRTRTIPSARVAFAQGCAVYDRYYFSYTPFGGASNTSMLVFDMTIGSFVLDTPGISGMSAEAICSSLIGGMQTVYCQSANLQCYEWENLASSSAVSAAVTSSALAPNGTERTFFGRVKLIGDVQSGQSCSVTKYLIAGGNPYGSVLTDASAIDMSAGVNGSQAYRYDCRVLGDGTNGPAGMSAVSAQIGLTLTMSPGSRIFAIENEHMPASPGGDSL